MFHFFQNGSISVERQCRILFRLILITFIITACLFAGLNLANGLQTRLLSSILFGLLLSSQALALYLLKKKVYESATLIFSLTFSLCALILAIFVGNILSLLPFLHLLGVIPLLLIFGEKQGSIYLRSVVMLHFLLITLRAYEVWPQPQVMLGYDILPPILFALSIVFFAFVFLVVQALAKVAFQATRNERKLGMAIGRLNEKSRQQKEIFSQLLKEKALREEAVDHNQYLEARSRYKDAFFATVSHELRTPLNAMIGRSQALKMGIYGELSTSQLETILGIETSGGHLLDLINDILDVAKITAGEMRINPESVNVRGLVEATIAEICPLAEQKRIEIEQLYVMETTHVVADAGRLRQILINLLSNALKFTPEGEKVGLMVTEHVSQNVIHFMIWDEGVGIPKERQKELFQPFIQIDNALSSFSAGTGLGLALVKQLAELHQGTVSVDSEIGKGSSFTVSLPIVQVEGGKTADTSQNTTISV